VNSLVVLLTVAGVHTLALIIPGPNVLVVSHAAASRSRRAGVFVALGVSAGALVWSASAAFGLATLLDRAAGLATAVRIAGAVFLMILGLRQLRAQGRRGLAAEDTMRVSTRTLFGRGLLVNLTNPKSILFFASVFAALLPPNATATLRIAAVVVVVVDALLWHTLLALAFSTLPVRRLSRRSGGRLRRVVGAAFVLFAVRLAVGAL
jgi:threonine efflux protein